MAKKKKSLISELEAQLKERKEGIKEEHQEEAERLQKELDEKQRELEALRRKQTQALGEASQKIVEGVFPTLVERLRAIERDEELTDRKKDNRIAAEVEQAIPFLSYANKHDAIRSIKIVWGEPCQNSGLDLDKLIEESQDLDHTNGFGQFLLPAPQEEASILDVEFTVLGKVEDTGAPTPTADGDKYIKNSDILRFLVPNKGDHRAAQQTFSNFLKKEFSDDVVSAHHNDHHLPVDKAREYIAGLCQKYTLVSSSSSTQMRYFKTPSESEINTFLKTHAFPLEEKFSQKSSRDKKPSGKFPGKTSSDRTMPATDFYKFFVTKHVDKPNHFEYATLTPFLNRRFSLFSRSDGKQGKAISEKDALAVYQAAWDKYQDKPWIKRLTTPQLENKIKQYFETQETPDPSPNNKSSSKMLISPFLRLVFKDDLSYNFYRDKGAYLEKQGLAESTGKGKGKRRFINLENIAEAYAALQKRFPGSSYFSSLTLVDVQSALLDISYQVPASPAPKKKSSKKSQTPQNNNIPFSEFRRWFTDGDPPNRFRLSCTDYLKRELGDDLEPVQQGNRTRYQIPVSAIKRAATLMNEHYTEKDFFLKLSSKQLERRVKEYFDGQVPNEFYNFSDPAPSPAPTKKSPRKSKPASAKDIKIITPTAIINYLAGQGYNKQEAVEEIKKAEKAGILGRPIRTDPLEPLGYDQRKVTTFYSTVKRKK
ncbi:MAG: V-type ATP synthase subunit E [Nanoarchaeota archaeon]|nr:V-type ATP synthase subunit E [Nanoarchaeota archaeon]